MEVGHSGRFGYIDTISELIDFRTVNVSSGSSVKFMLDRALHQENAEDDDKSYKIKMVAKSRHQNSGSQGTLDNDGGII